MSELEFYPEIPKEMKDAYNILAKKYQDIKSKNIEIKEDEEKIFIAFEDIAKQMANDSFDSKNYDFVYKTNNPNYKGDNLLEVWTKTVEYIIEYEGH